MLKYFFDIKNAEENKKLFNDLYISKIKEMESSEYKKSESEKERKGYEIFQEKQKGEIKK